MGYCEGTPGSHLSCGCYVHQQDSFLGDHHQEPEVWNCGSTQ